MDKLNQQAPVPQTQEKSHGSKMMLVIFGAVMITLIGLGGYVLGTKNTQAPVANNVISQPSPTPDPTANWKTYANSQFTFKYPLDWKISKGDFTILLPIEEYRLPSNLRKEMYPGEKYSPITITFDKFIADKADSTKEITKNDIIISGIRTTEHTRRYLIATNNYPSGNEEITVPLEHEGKSYVLRLHNIQYKNVFDQILSTFKFSNILDMSNWIIYVDKDKIYSFKYPSSMFYENECGKGLFDNHPFKDCGSERIYPFIVAKYEVALDNLLSNKDQFYTVEEKTVAVNGKQYAQYTQKRKSERPHGPGAYKLSVITVFPYGDINYLVEYIQADGEPDYLAIYNQIVSTFTFLDSLAR